MNKKWLFILVIPFFISCISMTDGWKELDLGAFKISIPKEWNYKKVQGEDSFVGEIIINSKTSLSFDYSSNGYANHLIQSDQEYIKSEDWMTECYFCKKGVIYADKSNERYVRESEMKKRGITDPSLIKIETEPDQEAKRNVHRPNAKQKSLYPKADYIADLTYKDSTILVPIELPDEIKSYHIKVDTTNLYIIKTIWPVIAQHGITGIYIKSRKSHLNFQLSGESLTKREQNLALLAFKTIKLKIQ